MDKIYLDNGSTSFPKAPGLGDAIKSFIENNGFNINRGGYEEAYEVSDMVYETRNLLLEYFNFYEGMERNVVFVPSVTYALNFVISGLLKAGDHVITSSMEHNAVARTIDALEKSGIEVTNVTCDEEGFILIDEFEKSFRKNTRLVVICHVSNVSGTIQDIETIGRITKEKGAFLVLDGAQSAGIVDIDYKKFNLSGLCIPGHKGLLGPQGIGAMLLSDELVEEITPVILGGTGSVSDSLSMPDFLPDKFEPGTLNLPGIAGINHCLKFVGRIKNDEILSHERKLSALFIEKITEFDPKREKIRIICPKDIKKRTGVVSLDFLTKDNAEIAYKLDSFYGIMTRCGLHCAPLAHKSLGTFPNGTVRFTFGLFNTEKDVEAAVSALTALLD